ncbi:MAG: type IX secretion system sortase PorU [Bacteroidetes bacterium]|nr:type IX secretion system sortase PorU [Bacteroidota bacterium]
MKLNFFVLASLLSSSFVFSQKYTIQWEGSKVQQFNETKFNLPSVKNYDFSYDQNNIIIHTKQKIGEKQLKIVNVVWENVNSRDVFDLNPYAFPSNEIVDINYIYNKEEQSNLALVHINGFRMYNGKVQRLASFELQPSTQLIYGNNATQKIGTTNNPLANGQFFKIKVGQSGVYKITKQFLQNNGINPANVNPKNFRIYGNGGIMLPEYNQDARYSALQEDAIQVVGEDDGVWDDGDYALFYAQGPDGYNLYDPNNGDGYKRTETRTDRAQHLKNIYEDASYYFINFDIGPGKRVQTVDETLPASLTTRYDAYQYINNDQKNLLKVGRTWVEEAPFTSNKNIVFNTNSAIQPNDEIIYRANVVSFLSQGNSIGFTINNQNPIVQPTSVSGQDFEIKRYSGVITNLSGNSLSIAMTPNIATNPNGLYYFDYAEVQYKENLSFNGGQMNFRDFSIVSGSNQKYGFSLSNASSVEQVWEVSDVTNPTRRVKKNSGATFDFAYVANSPNFNNEFVAFRADAAYQPTFVGKIENQNLADLQNIDYLIITAPEMFAQAQRLAQYHQTKNNFTTKIVDIQSIYNEYSSGSKDITAIRDFATHLNTPAGSLKYILLLGDATYDYKDRITNNYNKAIGYISEESANLVSSFITDDYIGMTEPQIAIYLGNVLPDVPVGRIPAATVTEATTMVDKTLAYYNSQPGQSSPFGEWRMKLDFVVDNDNDGGAPFHTVMNEALVDVFEGATDKPEYNVRKLYMDSFPSVSTSGGIRFPQVNQAISNDIGNSLYLFYFGHGGINGWAQERVLTSQEVQAANNYSAVYSRFPLVSTITCEFTLWDEPGTFSVGEQFIKHKQGGAATMITSSRAIAVDYGIKFTDYLTKSLFKLSNDDFRTLGDSFLEAKKEFNLVYSPGTNHMKVNYLGDPAMKLSRPKRLLVVDQIESPVPGLIRALDFVKVKGHINKANGALDTSFNGRVVINIFDKRLNKHNLTMTPILNYTEEGSAIVKASGMAVNGVFTVEFYVPNDINYTVGTGRMLGYADNKVFDVFNNQAVQVGDINPNGVNDNQPPKVKLYMNNTNFANGGITNQHPMLLACITDDTGINSTGAGVGHDITTYLDGEIVNTIVLNDYYSPGEGNGCLAPNLAEYQKGNVTYPFRNLSPGEHTLTFKVWDINNNSTTESLKFIVKDETNQHLIINRPLNWPNPFTDKTYIQFEHNCDDILDVNVQIYTITGKLVKTISQTVMSEPFLQGFRTPRQAIEWDGRDDFGDVVAKGTYIFKIFAKSQNQEKCKGSATAVEKMVLLK